MAETDTGTTTTQGTGTAGGTATGGTTQQTTTQGAGGTATGTTTTQTEQTKATDTGATASWRDTLKSDEAKEFAKNSPDLDHLVGRALDLRKQLSTAFVKPGKDAKPEEVAAYRKALDIPETADGYKFPLPDNRQPTDADKAFHAEVGKVFHEAGVSNAAAAKIAEWHNNRILEAQKAQDAADAKYAADSKAALEKKWGTDYPVNKTHADRAFKALAEKAGVDPDALLRIETKGGVFLLDNPELLQVFAAVGREMGEGSLGPVLTETERDRMEGELKTIRAGIETAKQNRDSKEADRLYQKEQELIRKIQGSRPIVGSQARAA